MKSDYAAHYRERQEKHWWFRARRRLLQEALSSLTLPSDSQIAEVGCGPGGNLEMLAKFGKVHACEMDPQLRAEASLGGIADILLGSLPAALPWNSPRFHCVGLFDVLEHVEDDHAALQALRKITLANGHLALTVPAFNFLWSPHDDANHHFRRYTNKTLSEVISGSGWQIEHLTYFNCFLFPAALLQKIASRWRVPSDGDTMPVPHPAVNEVLYHIMSSEAPLVHRRHLPFGSSLLCLARNPG